MRMGFVRYGLGQSRIQMVTIFHGRKMIVLLTLMLKQILRLAGRLLGLTTKGFDSWVKHMIM